MILLAMSKSMLIDRELAFEVGAVMSAVADGVDLTNNQMAIKFAIKYLEWQKQKEENSFNRQMYMYDRNKEKERKESEKGLPEKPPTSHA